MLVGRYLISWLIHSVRPSSCNSGRLMQADSTVVFAISLLLRANSKSAPSNISRKRRRKGIIILTATATIIRLELALFLIPLALTLLLTRRMGLTEVLVCGAIGGFGSLGPLHNSHFPIPADKNSYIRTNRLPTLATHPHPPKFPIQITLATSLARVIWIVV